MAAPELDCERLLLYAVSTLLDSRARLLIHQLERTRFLRGDHDSVDSVIPQEYTAERVPRSQDAQSEFLSQVAVAEVTSFPCGIADYPALASAISCPR